VTYDIIWLGRGGQGGVTAARLLAEAAVERGLYALAIPFFGAERRGAPVFAFNRVSRNEIRKRSRVRRGDLVVVLDASTLEIHDPRALLKPGGRLIVNGFPRLQGLEAYCLDAVSIAEALGLRLAGFPLVNMPMLGAAAKVSGLVDLDALSRVIRRDFSRLVEENIEAVKRGYEEVGRCG